MLAGDIERGFTARDAGCAPPERFFDVWYTQLMADPIGVARAVYRHFDLPLGPEVEARMRAYLATNPKDRHGAHRYSLEQFGLDGDGERARYRAYWDRWREPRPR